MTRPLVSIMLPCFNSAESIRLAAGSLVAQTMTDWECVCLDDGSTDDTWAILTDLAKRDRRFKTERFPENRGRGAARQRALELATGKYLAFCDSDDWMYPTRLATEVRWMECDSKIKAVSVCGAVTVGSDKLVGVLRPNPGSPLPVVEMFQRPVPPPLLFPASMIDTELAQKTGFDKEFRRSQDSDFLMRALLGKHYALSGEVLYGYSQGSAASLERTLEGYRYRVRAHMRHVRDYPLRVGRTDAATGAKMLAYRAAALVGMDQKLIERRWSQTIEPAIAEAFAAALAEVQRSSAALFA